MGGGYKADTTPLLKALLHGAKFPSCSVNGVLLGFDGGDADGVHVVDAVPLFHTALPLAPHLEVALAMVDAYVKAQQGGLQIVGYYQADAAYGVTELGKTGKAIADRLHQQTKASCALLIDSKKLAAMVNEKEDLPFEFEHRLEMEPIQSGGAQSAQLLSLGLS
eukprot:evm.model.scf_213EXC.8 EVM.evm.TU.scf_213EXC.8   scf_213EXC:76385-80157(-)